MQKIKDISTLLLSSIICIGMLSGCGPTQTIDKQEEVVRNETIHKLEADLTKMDSENIWPRTQTRVPSDEKRIDEILRAMSIEDKVGQLVMAEIRHVTPADVKKYRLGGILNGGGAFPNNDQQASAEEWLALAQAFYEASIDRDDDQPKIPVLWGTDAVHGHNNVYGATVFPHNIGLGATRNPSLLEEIGAVTAAELSATGIYWTFAPTVAVPKDDRWGRTYEGYSEDVDIVAELSSAMIEGLQGKLDKNFLGNKQVIATAKHFIGDGGTENGVDQGDTQLSEKELSEQHGKGYFTALDAGVQTVMASFNSWNGKKIHGDHYLLTEVLKNKMGFDGLVVGDWNGHGQVPGCSNSSCPASINAGVDMVMVPEDWKALYENTLQQAKDGEISAARIDDAVRRILRVKMRLKIFDDNGPQGRSNAGKQSLIGHVDHREVARRAVRESLVLLKNNKQVLPLKAGSKILVAGSDADELYNQLGGWSITWQGTETTQDDFPGATRVVDGIQTAVEAAGGQFEFNTQGDYQNKPDAAIVIFSEQPYAEGPGDRDHLAFSPDDREHLQILKKLKNDGIPVVSIFMSGRPMWINPELNASDAFVAAWLPGTEGQGVADVIFCEPKQFTDCGFTGKLSFSWPKSPMQTPLNVGQSEYDPLFQLGYGLTYADRVDDMPNLSENASEINASAIGKYIFKGRGIAPYSVYLQEGEQLPISARQSPSQTRNDGVRITVFDRELQEDAQRISFGGRTKNSWQLQINKTTNWTKEAEQGAVLAFDIKLLQTAAQQMYLSMECGNECNAEKDISENLRAIQDNAWHTLGISLKCLEELGADLTNIYQPLRLSTTGVWEIELSSIRLEKPDNVQLIVCSDVK